MTLVGRTYEDFQDFHFRHPEAAVVEVDSAIGKRGGKVLLTMMLRNYNFMLPFLRKNNPAVSVAYWFFTQLRACLYKRMFQVVRADNGTVVLLLSSSLSLLPKTITDSFDGSGLRAFHLTC